MNNHRHDKQPKPATKRPTPPGARPPVKAPAPLERPHHGGNGQRVSWTDAEDSSPSGKREDPRAAAPEALAGAPKSDEDDAADDEEEDPATRR